MSPILFTDYSELSRKPFLVVFAVLILLCQIKPAMAEDKVGKVVFARGVVSAQSTAGEIRILGKDAAIYPGDVISTGPKSFAVISMNDGARLSLRPNTVLSINEYIDKAGAESATMKLFKGGLRAISGLISKRNPEAFKVRTDIATIGIRGTEFDARLCEADCASEMEKIAERETVMKSQVIGRVVFIRGEASAQQDGKAARILTRGSPIYELDEIVTLKNAYVILAFRDRGQVTIKAESRFKVEKFHFDQNKPEKDSSVFQLTRGGMRALTGLMGKRSPESYKVKTAVTVIGIRGTGFDLLWLGPCTNLPECGLVASVWQGDITSNNDAGLNLINLNESVRIRTINRAPELMDRAPIFTVPRPDTIKVNFDKLFATQGKNTGEPGLYVACYDGHCAMRQQDRELDLGAGEAGFASLDGQRLLRLDQIAPFQENDPYLNTINEQFDTLYELLDEKVTKETEFECVVQ